jgi:uncharacterized protein YcfJ
MTMKRHIISFALLGALAAGVTGAAFAQGRDAASLRASGAAGEQSDGFMAAAGAASFQNRLNCTNVPQRSCIASGNYIRMGGGAWTRK